MDSHEMREWLQGRLDRIDDRMTAMGDTLARQTASLEHYTSRTKSVEKRVEEVAKLKERASGAWWLVGAIALVTGVVLSAIKLSQ